MVRDIQDTEVADVSQGPAELVIPYRRDECKEKDEDDNSKDVRCREVDGQFLLIVCHSGCLGLME